MKRRLSLSDLEIIKNLDNHFKLLYKEDPDVDFIGLDEGSIVQIVSDLNKRFQNNEIADKISNSIIAESVDVFATVPSDKDFEEEQV